MVLLFDEVGVDQEEEEAAGWDIMVCEAAGWAEGLLNPGGSHLGWNSEPGDGACHRNDWIFFDSRQDKREVEETEAMLLRVWGTGR